MPRILFGVNGEGFGHSSRAHSIGLGLIQRGHDVRFVTAMQSTAYLSEHFPGLTHDIMGLHIAYRGARVAPLRTFGENAAKAARGLFKTISILAKVFADFKPDLVLTDFEPFVVYAAHRRRIRVVSIDNQHLLTHCRVERPPGTTLSYLQTYLVIRWFHVGSRRYLVSSFIDAPARKRNVTLVPAIVRPQVMERDPVEGDYLVFYKGVGEDHGAVTQSLIEQADGEVRAYGLPREGREGRVWFRPRSTEGFLDDLAGCKGVIATGGHSLVCECIALRKPMLLLPAHGHFEQEFNAYSAQRLGYAIVENQLSTAIVSNFVDQCHKLARNLAAGPRPDIDLVLDAIEAEIPVGRPAD